MSTTSMTIREQDMSTIGTKNTQTTHQHRQRLPVRGTLFSAGKLHMNMLQDNHPRSSCCGMRADLTTIQRALFCGQNISNFEKSHHSYLLKSADYDEINRFPAQQRRIFFPTMPKYMSRGSIFHSIPDRATTLYIMYVLFPTEQYVLSLCNGKATVIFKLLEL